MTQTDLARSILTRQATVSNIESGKSKPSAELRFRIEDTTGIPARDWSTFDADAPTGEP
jgi:transcriptional regulator with XRE-family HTH domain